MGSGLLTGAMTRERIAALPDDDWRKHDEPSRSRRCRGTWRLVERLPVAARHGRAGRGGDRLDAAQPGGDGAIVGFRRPGQVDPLLAADDLELTRRISRRSARPDEPAPPTGRGGQGARAANGRAKPSCGRRLICCSMRAPPGSAWTRSPSAPG